MERTGLVVSKIYKAAVSINFGRKGFAIIGKERKGRITYERGIAAALAIFKQVQSSTDPKTKCDAILPVLYNAVSRH